MNATRQLLLVIMGALVLTVLTATPVSAQHVFLDLSVM